MWAGYVPIAVDYTKVAADLTDFPLYISGAGLPDAFWLGRTDGADLVVTDSSNAVLPFELVHIDTAGKALELHVQTDLSDSAATNLRIWYGNGAHSVSLADPDAVWAASYVGVWHMPGGAGNAADSTANGLTGADNVSQTGTTGKLYSTGGQQFDNNDYYLVGDAAALDVGAALTMEGWFNLDAALPETTLLMYRLNSYYMSVTDTGRLMAVLYQGAASKYSYRNAAVSAGGWHHIAAAWARPLAYVDLYVDGLNVGRTSTVVPGDADVDATANPFRIGYTSSSIVGHADEVRLSNAARSAAWLLTQYRNQSDPATFYSVGAAVTTNRYDDLRLMGRGIP